MHVTRFRVVGGVRTVRSLSLLLIFETVCTVSVCAGSEGRVRCKGGSAGAGGDAPATISKSEAAAAVSQFDDTVSGGS